MTGRQAVAAGILVGCALLLISHARPASATLNQIEETFSIYTCPNDGESLPPAPSPGASDEVSTSTDFDVNDYEPLPGEWWRTTNYSRSSEYGVDHSYWDWTTYDPSTGFDWCDYTPCRQGEVIDWRWIKGEVFVPAHATSVFLYGQEEDGILTINDGMKVYANGTYVGMAWTETNTRIIPPSVHGEWATWPWDLTDAVVPGEVNSITITLIESCYSGGIGGFYVGTIIPKVDIDIAETVAEDDDVVCVDGTQNATVCLSGPSGEQREVTFSVEPVYRAGVSPASLTMTVGTDYTLVITGLEASLSADDTRLVAKIENEEVGEEDFSVAEVAGVEVDQGKQGKTLVGGIDKDLYKTVLVATINPPIQGVDCVEFRFKEAGGVSTGHGVDRDATLTVLDPGVTDSSGQIKVEVKSSDLEGNAIVVAECGASSAEKGVQFVGIQGSIEIEGEDVTAHGQTNPSPEIFMCVGQSKMVEPKHFRGRSSLKGTIAVGHTVATEIIEEEPVEEGKKVAWIVPDALSTTINASGGFDNPPWVEGLNPGTFRVRFTVVFDKHGPRQRRRFLKTKKFAVVNLDITFASGEPKLWDYLPSEGFEPIPGRVGCAEVTIKATPASLTKKLWLSQNYDDKYYLTGSETRPTRTESGFDEIFGWHKASAGHKDQPNHGPAPPPPPPADVGYFINWASEGSELRRRFEATSCIYASRKGGKVLCERKWGFDIKLKIVRQLPSGDDVVEVESYDYWPKPEK
jgi:hypothetical protein